MKVTSQHQSPRIFILPDGKRVSIQPGDSEIDDETANSLLGMAKGDANSGADVVAAHLSGIIFHGASGNVSAKGKAGEDKARADKAEAENERLKARIAELESEKPAAQADQPKPAQPPKKPER